MISATHWSCGVRLSFFPFSFTSFFLTQTSTPVLPRERTRNTWLATKTRASGRPILPRRRLLQFACFFASSVTAVRWLSARPRGLSNCPPQHDWPIKHTPKHKNTHRRMPDQTISAAFFVSPPTSTINTGNVSRARVLACSGPPSPRCKKHKETTHVATLCSWAKNVNLLKRAFLQQSLCLGHRRASRLFSAQWQYDNAGYWIRRLLQWLFMKWY